METKLFIRYTQLNRSEDIGRMEFVPYDHFKDIEFIAEGGFSRVYKATWIDGPIEYWKIWNEKEQKYNRRANEEVVLKKLNNSENLTSKELNEVLYISYYIYFIIMNFNNEFFFSSKCFIK